MLCQNCKINDSTIHLYTNLNGQQKQIDLCQNCYKIIKTDPNNSLFKGITDLNKEYDKFLTKLDSVLNYVGTSYGLYIQVKESIRAIRDLKTALRKHPTGLLATSLSARKNGLILDVSDTTGKLINDIRDVFLRKENRISKKSRITLLEGIRENITTLNKKMWMLSRAITYTSLVDDWNEFVGLATSYKKKSKEIICKEAMHRWSRAAHMTIR